MSDAIAVRGEAAEVALGEAQAVLSMVSDEERRGRLADLIAAVGEGEVGEEDAAALTELLELGLQTGRLRAVYGPGGEADFKNFLARISVVDAKGKTWGPITFAGKGTREHLFVQVGEDPRILKVRRDLVEKKLPAKVDDWIKKPESAS